MSMGNIAKSDYAEDYGISSHESLTINVMKVLSIIAVVYIHASAMLTSPEAQDSSSMVMVQLLLRAGLLLPAVPAFFLISAVLLYRKPFTFSQNIRKKVRTLILPYLIWNSLWIGIVQVCNHSTVIREVFVNKDIQPLLAKNIMSWNIGDWVNAYFGISSDWYPFVYPLWFLKDLIILNFFAVILKKIIDRFPLFAIAGIAILWFSRPELYLFHANSLVYFSLGYVLVKYHIHLGNIISIRYTWLIPVYILCLASVFVFAIRWYFQPVVTVLGLLIGLKLSASIAGFPSWKKHIPSIVSSVMLIYVMHEYLLTICESFFRAYMHIQVMLVLEFVFLPLLVMIAILGLGITLKKFSFPVYSLITGNRG